MAARLFAYTAFDSDGDPESGALLNVFTRNTQTRVPWYTNVGLTVPATNPVVANGAGRLALYFSDADEFSITITTADAAEPILQGDIIGGVLFVSGGDAFTVDASWLPIISAPFDGIRQFAIYADMTAMDADTGLMDDGVYYTRGRAAESDGGAGHWRYDSGSSTSANGGTILAVDGGGVGRFFRLMTDEKVFSALWFAGATFGAQLAAAITAGGAGSTITYPYRSAGGFVVAQTQTLNSYQILRGVGGYKAQLTRGVAGTLLDMSAEGCRLENAQLNGVSATYSNTTTDKLVALTNGSNGYQGMKDVTLADAAGPCLDFNASNAGFNFFGESVLAFRANLANAAIVGPTTIDSGAGHREFVDCHGAGGILFKLNKGLAWKIRGGSGGVDWTGSNGVGLVSSIMGMRIVNAPDIDGADTTISGCMFAAGLTLASGSGRNELSANIYNGSVVDNSTQTGDNVNRLVNYVTVVPLWKGDTADPALASVLTARVEINGRSIRVQLALSMDGSTTFGTDAWYFTLPSPFAGFVAKAGATGVVRMFDSGTIYRVGAAFMTAGSNRIYVIPDSATAFASATVPFTWATGDTMFIDIEFEKS
jgi:hypothetical protein